MELAPLTVKATQVSVLTMPVSLALVALLWARLTPWTSPSLRTYGTTQNPYLCVSCQELVP